jgi:hypothetical protein
MSTQEHLTALLNNSTPHERLQFAVRVRDAYVQQIRDTKTPLNPAMLRTLNANIEQFRSQAD